MRERRRRKEIDIVENVYVRKEREETHL